MEDHKKGGKNPLLPFLLLSLFLHILIFILLLRFPVLLPETVSKPKEKPKVIEITEVPIPEEKETEPPPEPKRYAERSHKAPEEKVRDEYTKRPTVVKKTPPKPEVKKEVKKERPKKETTKPKELPKKQIASLPKEEPKELIPREELFKIPQEEMLGARDVKKKEDTVDLNTTEFKYFSYFAKLKRDIELVWNYPESARIRGEQGELFLVFTIRRDGRLEDVKLLDSSGYALLDNEAVRAIRVASPYSPFPESWELERLHVRALFRYQIQFGWKVQ